MKLKYYMRGLGVGIILTTLIFMISGSKETLSDQEIMKRAAVLGMEMKEDKKEDLDKVLNEMDLTKAPTQSPDSTPAVTPTLTPTPTEGPTPTANPTIAPTQKPTATPTKAPEIEKEDIVKASGGKKKITFTIESGMSSGQVSNILLEAGLVENADDFNKYIVNKGKASIIRVGTYSLLEGTTYDEIIKTITTK